MFKVMSIVKGLSVKLQSSSIDISKAYKDVDSTCLGLQHFRDNVLQHSDRWFKYAAEKVREAVGELDYDPSLPRRCGSFAQMFQQRRQKSTLEGLLLFRFWITSLVK